MTRVGGNERKAVVASVEPSPESSRFRRIWKWFGALVTAASIAWMLVLLARTWPVLSVRLNEIDSLFLYVGLFLLTLSVYLNFEAFAALAGMLGIAGMPRRQLAHLYFIGQLLKHAPGRIWGMGYQSAAGASAAPAGTWLLANLVHMLLATLFALWSIGVVLAGVRGLPVALLAVLGGLLVYIACWRYASSVGLQGAVGKLPGRLGRVLRDGMVAMASTPRGLRVRLTFAYAISLLLLYCAWAMFGLAYPPLGASGGVRLCAIYMVAWFVGFVSLLTPSGLGVRELAFAWLAHGFGMDVVALMVIIGRSALLSADLLLGLLFAPFFPSGATDRTR